MEGTQRPQPISTGFRLIAEQAAAYPERVFTSLAHLLDVEMLREAYRLTRKDGATGVDGVTAAAYGEHLEENLADLHDRLRTKRYTAPPVERAWIDKAVYHPEQGTPQGGVISPLLANIYLHYVLDEWFETVVRPRMKGPVILIRFADDFVIGCELAYDARRIMAVLPKRFNRFNLTIHPKKTALVEFGSPNSQRRSGIGKSTFDFLGFTHYWGTSRRGYWVIKRKTAAKRLRRAMKRLGRWCCYNRHLPLSEQHRILSSKLRGHYQYYGIRGNYKMMEVLMEHVERAWCRWLGRRHRNGAIPYEKFAEIRETFPLPMPRIVHSI